MWTAANVHADLPSIQRTTATSGSRTGYAELNVPDDLHLLGQGEPQFEFADGGPILGAVLRANDPLPGSRQHPQYEVLRLGARDGDGGVFAGVSDGAGEDHGTLPAGDYRLYLIAAAAGTVTIYFPDVTSGELALAPNVFTPFSSGPLPALSWSSPHLTVFGQADSLVSQGLVYERAIVRRPALGQRLEICEYDGGADRSAGSSAYTQNCPGASVPGYSTTATSSDDLGLFSLGFATVADRYGIGGNVSAPLLPIDQPGALETYGMWMSYDFAPPGPPSSDDAGSPGESTPPPYPASGTPQSGGSGSRSGSLTTRGGGSARGTLSFYIKRLVVHRRRTGFRVLCSRDGPCEGTASLSPGMRAVHLRVNSGDSAHVNVVVSRAIARRLARRRKVRSVLRVRSVTEDGAYEQRAEVVLLSHSALPRRNPH